MPRRRRLAAGLALVLLSILGFGCVHVATPVPEPGAQPGAQPGADITVPPSAATGLAAEDLDTQSLFRVRYDGPQGSGTLRLVLRIESGSRYLLETRDRFGRSLWRIFAQPTGTTLIDDRRRLVCLSRGDIRIPEIALESLPLGELPAILLGRLPGNLVAGISGDYWDEQARRWTVTGPPSEPEAWTLWEAGEPWVWWRREGSAEGVLSHRGGAQLRSKRVAVETLTGGLPEPDTTADYLGIHCEDWPVEERAPA